MLVDYIDQHRDRFGVEPICTVLKDAGVQVAPSTYYTARQRPPSARSVRDAALVEDIKVAHKANLGVYGARKIHAELNREGIPVARCTVERLMRAEGLRGIPREKTRKTTIGDGAETERPEDLVDRKFVATAPNELWVADIKCRHRHLMSVTHSWFGPLRLKSRSTRSVAMVSGLIRRHFFRPLMPCSPARCISSSTWPWPTRMPRPMVSSAWTLRAP
ncbi:hypothetical protein GCM10027062_23830 [Nocardioides hungaricus]